ncbi:MopE-related protein [Lutibacter sp.]|uniref:MopE-related protein n=1 Tax=Lutibacter sp. TaxID=1925666 RepID=UPI001A1966B3|nr:MopE-related protein [Lutibacter sp.]MBI9041919.1 hypothetical protein [Lutibacter sp.]
MKQFKRIMYLLFLAVATTNCHQEIIATTETGIVEIEKNDIANRSAVLVNDMDGDGCLDENDTHINSNRSATISIDGCDIGIPNSLVDCGTTMMDQIVDAIETIAIENVGSDENVLRKKFTRELSKLSYYWVKKRLISTKERSNLSGCGYRANFQQLLVLLDRDGDGFVPETNLGIPGGDCDDSNPLINPSAVEICNGKDDDCDGQIDEGVQTTYFRDADGDGFGTDEFVIACAMPVGFAQYSGDCDDTKETINPDAVEICNGEDDDCDGQIDEGVQTTYFRDADGDGFGTDEFVLACEMPAGYAKYSGDCDDSNETINPDAVEICNGIDDNCDGILDDEIYCAAVSLKNQLEQVSITIETLAGPDGKLFGSVTPLMVSNALYERGFDIDRKQITFPNVIKETGSYLVYVDVYRNVRANVSINVVPKEKY